MATSVPARVLLGLVLLIFTFSSSVSGTRTKDKIYIPLLTQNGCFRTLNATHQFGCTSAFRGNVGVLQYLETLEDRELVVRSGPHAPYVVLMEAQDFNISVLEELVRSERVAGVLVNDAANDTTQSSVTEFSPDKTCPNDGYGLYHNDSKYRGCAKQEWNSVGSGMFFQDFSIPIFVITVQSDMHALLTQCYNKFNRPINGTARSYPLCAVELKDRMSAVKDTVTCLRRSNLILNLDPVKVCDPMGDNNIITSVKVVPKGTPRQDKSIIMAATRMDSFSMFSNEYQSADTSVSGIVALLAAAEVIGKVQGRIRNSTTAKDIMFTFFQGEAFDYIGSSRMVYDMEKSKVPTDNGDDEGQRPIHLSHISSFLELSQVALREDGKLWIHTDPVSRGNHPTTIAPETDRIADLMVREGAASGSPMGKASNDLPLPPASVQRFLRKTVFPSVVLTDHQTAFTNRFYNSRFDVASIINASYPSGLNESEKYDYVTPQAESLANLSTALARTLFNLSTGEELDAKMTANATTVTHLLYCFLHDPHCELFNSIISQDDAKSLAEAKKPFPFYVSIYWLTNQVTSLTQRILARFLGERVDLKKGDCKAPSTDQTYTFTWMQGDVKPNSADKEREGRCYKSTVYLTTAKSPAFDVSGYDMLSGEYSTFAESVWSGMGVRLFLVPSDQWETVIFSVGVILLIVSFVIVYLLNVKANVVFASRSAEYL